MNRAFLIETANQLKQVSSLSADEYALKSDQLIGKMNQLMLEKDDIESLVGKDNLAMMKDNHSNHVRFMLSVFRNYTPEVLVETILWVFRAYRSHGFTTNYWARQLNTWIGLLKDELSSDCYFELYPYYEWMQINIPLFVKVSDEKLDASEFLH
ncbi:hypothetical protein [Mangrovibacterium sp.]|uniref:hypothetical protein n=1 Tax=Mangrovibacterium sp. TaxID=1961364 RepID=UPI003561E0A2